MATTLQKMEIDVNKPATTIITAVQSDTASRYLDVVLYQNGVPIDLTGHEVKIFAVKPKTKLKIFNVGEITEPENGRCQFEMTNQMLAEFGYLETQIGIWKNNEEILSTPIFSIMVSKTLIGLDAIESTNEYGALVLLFQNLYEAKDQMEAMIAALGVPGEYATEQGLTTGHAIWDALLKYMQIDLTNKINQALANASVQGVLDLIGTPSDTSSNTLMGLINGLPSVVGGVKSVQEVAVRITKGAYNDTGTLATPVTSDKVYIVHKGTSDVTSITDYSIVNNGTQLKVDHSPSTNDGWTTRFYVFEYY